MRKQIRKLRNVKIVDEYKDIDEGVISMTCYVTVFLGNTTKKY